MAVSLRAVFQEPGIDLRQEASGLNLDAPPVSLRQLVAAEALQGAWLKNDGVQGMLGAQTSPVQPSDAGSFAQDFRGGGLRVTNDGSVSLDGGQIRVLQVEFVGIDCFGNPGIGKSDSVYGIISLVGNEDAKYKVWNLPNDSTGYDHWDDLEAGQSRDFGHVTLNPGSVPAPTVPQPITLNCVLMRCSSLGGCHSDDAKSGIESSLTEIGAGAGAALGTVGGGFVGSIIPGVGTAAGAAFGAPIGAAIGAAIGTAIGNFIHATFDEDTMINAVNTTFSSPADIDALGPPRSKRMDNLLYNFETPIITDGDSSYKLYFNIWTDTISADLKS